jgi:hypothetical protein
VFCPECGVEYREGFTECADCRVSLVAEAPPEPQPGLLDLELVTVLECNNAVATALAKATLEEAGIPFCTQGEELGPRMEALSPYFHPWCRFQVAREREAEARALLRPIEEAGAG